MVMKYVQIQISGEVNETAKKLGKDLRDHRGKDLTAKIIWEIATDYFCSLPEEEIKKIINNYTKIK